MELGQTVRSGMRWSLGMRLLSQLFTWSITLVILRILSPGDYGLMALAAVFMEILGHISGMGLGAAIVQKKDLKQEDTDTVFGFSLLISLCISALQIGSASFVADFYDEPQLFPILCALSLLFVISSLAVVPSSLLLRDLNFKKLAITEFSTALCGSIVTLILALLGMGVWALVIGLITMRVMQLLILWYLRPYFRRPRFAFKRMLPILAFSVRVTISRILWYFYAHAAASLIVGKVMGTVMLGFFNVALYLACLPMEKVGGIINQVAFPAFSSVQDNVDLVGRHYLKAVRILSFIAFPVFWGISSVAPELIGVFLGQKWALAEVPLTLLALVVPFRMIRNLMMPALLGLGRADIDLRNELIAMALLPVSFLVGVNWGLLGVSLVWVLVFPVVFILNMLNFIKIIQIRARDIFKAMSVPLIIGLIMGLAVNGMEVLILDSLNIHLRLLLQIGIGVTVYTSLSYAFNQDNFIEVYRMKN